MPDRNQAMVLTAEYIADLIKVLQYGGDVPTLPEGVTYRGVYSLAKRHSLAGALWPLLEDAEETIADPELVSAWAAERERDFAKNLVQTREFKSITTAFTEAGIPFLPMKGFIFKALWVKPEYRTMSDIDIYVSDSGIDRASEVLRSLGYTLEHSNLVHDSYAKPPFMNIELHRALERDHPASFPDWSAREDNPCWYEMSDVDFLVFNVAHMYKHYKGGGSGIRSFFDLHLFLAAKKDVLDPDTARTALEAAGLYEFYLKAVALSEFWFGDREADNDIRATEYFIVTGGTYGNVENRVEHALKHESGAKYFFRRTFPSYRSMCTIYGWLKPLPFLLPIAWIVRLVGALFTGRMGRELKAVDKARKETKE